MAGDSFSAFVRGQLGGLAGVAFRRMFGGEGIYRDGTFFGILYRGRLYFKTDAATRPVFVAAGMGPFQPNAKQCLPAYYEVPAAVLEDAVELRAWALRAAQFGPAGKVVKPKQSPPAKRRRR